MSYRILLGAIAFSFLSCTQYISPSDRGDAKAYRAPTASLASAALSAPPAPTVLSFENEPRLLSVKPISETVQLEADAARSSDGKYFLEVAEGNFPKVDPGIFLVRTGPTRRLVLKRSGWYARWVAESEVAFLDATGQLMKLDVNDPQRTTTGGRVCGTELECSTNEPPQLEWVSRDLERAVVRTLTNERELFIVRIGKVARLPLNLEPGFQILAHAVNQGGTLCVFIAQEPRQAREPIGSVEPSAGRLLCAEPSWTAWQRVREFLMQGRLDWSREGVHLKFFSEREVLVSLPSSKDPTANGRYDHCIVSLNSAGARCAPGARPEWFPLGDGRWLIEATVVSTSPPRLIDVMHSRSWAIGDDKNAVWWEPKVDSRSPKTLVMQREDKANVRAGTLFLPDDR